MHVEMHFVCLKPLLVNPKPMEPTMWFSSSFLDALE